MNYRYDGPDGSLRLSFEDDGWWHLFIYGTDVGTYTSAEDAAIDVASHNTGYTTWDDEVDADSPDSLGDWNVY